MRVAEPAAACAHDAEGPGSSAATWACTCAGIEAGAVGWCARHSRGFAYGQVFRTKTLLEPLLPVAADPCRVNGSAGARDATTVAGRPRTETYRRLAHGHAITLLNAGSLTKMVNALPRDGKRRSSTRPRERWRPTRT